MAARGRPLQAHLRHRRAEKLPQLANDGRLSPQLPEGTPFGLVGTSSLYKRESYPNGGVPKGSVTARWTGGKNDNSARTATTAWNCSTARMRARSTGSTRAPTPASTATTTSTPSASWRWSRPPTAIAGRSRAGCSTTMPRSGCASWARSRCGSSTPTANSRSTPTAIPTPASSPRFPADTPFTFQTLNKDGMVLNMAQTWHQVRPGEVRNNCGGCHAHSAEAHAVREDRGRKARLSVFDLTRHAAADDASRPIESHRQWDARATDRPALRDGGQERRVFPRRRPILRTELRRLPHRQMGAADGQPGPRRRTPTELPEVGKGPGHLLPAGGRPQLQSEVRLQADLARNPLALPERLALCPHVPVPAQPAGLENLRPPHRRLDERRPPTETVPGRSQPRSSGTASRCRRPSENITRADLDYTGSIMPPPEAVAGTFAGPDGKKIKVEPLIRRGPADDHPLDRPGLPDRPRLRPTASRTSRLRLDVRRHAADAHAPLSPSRARTRA